MPHALRVVRWRIGVRGKGGAQVVMHGSGVTDLVSIWYKG